MGRKKSRRSKKAEPSLKAEWSAWFQAKRPIVIFCAKFGGLMALLYAFLATSYGDRLLYGYLEFNAWLSNAILNGLGQPTHLSGVSIQSQNFAVTIMRGCDAIEPTWLICAAMLSIRAPWLDRFLGMSIGIIVLQALNLIRIITLYLIGLRWPAGFNSAHLEIWPVLFILIAIALFVYWREWTFTRQAHHAAS